MQEMDVELGQESVALCRSLRLKVTDGVPRGAVNPGRFYFFRVTSVPSIESLPSMIRRSMVKGPGQVSGHPT